MDAVNRSGELDREALQDEKQKARELVRWYRTDGRAFIERHAPEQLPPFDNDAERLDRLVQTPDSVTACFLGHSGIGKSTLLNALAAGAENVLPSGGVGPLTAQATEVRYSAVPEFSVRYHKRRKLWNLVFALERTFQSTTANAHAGSDVPPEELDDDLKSDVQAEIEAAADPDDDKATKRFDRYRGEALKLVAGDQFADRSVPYLIDALRVACDQKPLSQSQFQAEDLNRIDRIREALAIAEKDAVYRRSGNDGKPFNAELKDHAAGFLGPLVDEIVVGWPSDLLKSGVTLVDLPGVGTAGDSYRQVTQKFIRNSARAVILTVNRAGPTEETIELLRASGYWDRVVGASDDPNSDPCKLFIAVTNVDVVAEEEWRNSTASPRPKKREVYADFAAQFRVQMKAQIAEQLGKIGGSANSALEQARSKARETILKNLEIFPVSAPEYRKILNNDEDDRPFLKNEEESGILALRAQLQSVARDEKLALISNISSVANRLREGVSGELKRLERLWRDRARAASITEALEKELDLFLKEKRQERALRVGMFREFLETTAQNRIRQLVSEARETAQQEVAHFLKSLRSAHWSTLRATVRRGGAFVGKRSIHLPEEIAGFFQEPMAGVWSTKLLTEVRKRTTDFANDQIKLVDEICEWAAQKTSSASQAEALEQQKQRIARQAAQMQQVGKEAVAEMRQAVKSRVMDAVRVPIKRSCERFVKKGNDVGPGVKSRILELFDELSREATKAAEAPAIAILEENFAVVRADIKSAFENWGDPLQQTADLILQREKQEIEQKSERERDAILAEIVSLMKAFDPASPAHERTASHA